MKRAVKWLLLLGLCALLATFAYYYPRMSQYDENYSDILGILESDNVSHVEIEETKVTFTFIEEIDGLREESYDIYSVTIFYDDFNDILLEKYEEGSLTYSYPKARVASLMKMVIIVISIILTVLLMGSLFSLYRSRGRRGGGGGGGMMGGHAQFGKAKTRVLSENEKTVTFDQVCGADEEKEELQEVVDFLKNPAQFYELGARIPRGILLVGPPGTGKTLLAKAVAGEAGVHFLSISGSDFVELYVGVGASRVRDLFAQAKKEEPAIVFIDEIDAVGRQRGAGLGGGHDEREQTLNQLLVEMDGFAGNTGVIVMAATNRADILDPALLRPGRFDRQIYVGLPDMGGREEILELYGRKKPLADDVRLGKIAKATSGFTGADLENLMNEAALLAARKRQQFITMKNMEDAMIKVIAGPEKKSRIVTAHAKKLTAYHEAGHAVVMHALETQDPVHQITIVPRGQAGGMTISLPTEDRPYRTKRELQETICGLLGGRVAEEQVLGDGSTGASNDLQRATAIARAMVTQYGMSERVGTLAFDESQEVFIGRSMSQARSYSEEVAGIIDSEIRRIVDEAYVRCGDILKEKRKELDIIAQYLIAHETMHRPEFLKVYENPEELDLTAPTKRKVVIDGKKREETN